LLLYWGWFWRPVYDAAPLIVAQLLFAYAFDVLLCWSRRDTYAFGFGPLPIIFSINLFLWFKPDWFYLQFVMVAFGFAAKEFLRWEKDGHRTHIFNPSSFPLAVFSIGLIATGASDITWGNEIAITQFYPPHIYLVLFLAGLPGQYLFGVTTMTMSAVLTTYVFGLFYFAATGIYFFYDSYIPISVFLGMHLLFTDPATSPRTELGRILYGVLYGLSAVALYQLLGTAGMPTFYDKLLQVLDAPAAPACLHIRLGGHLRGDECDAGRGRYAPRAVASVLAADVRRRPGIRVSVSRRYAAQHVLAGIALVLQRSRHSARGVVAVWRRSAQTRSVRRDRALYARVRPGVSSRM
jgi:hypothetical protein